MYCAVVNNTISIFIPGFQLPDGYMKPERQDVLPSDVIDIGSYDFDLNDPPSFPPAPGNGVQTYQSKYFVRNPILMLTVLTYPSNVCYFSLSLPLILDLIVGDVVLQIYNEIQ